MSESFTAEEIKYIRETLIPKNFDEIATKYDSEGKSLAEFQGEIVEGEMVDADKKRKQVSTPKRHTNKKRKTEHIDEDLELPELELEGGKKSKKAKSAKKSKKSKKSRKIRV